MEFFGRDERPMTSLRDWRTGGKPAADSHWAPGRSAFELAGAWLRGDAAERATALLTTGCALDLVELERAVPEKKTQFDGNARGARNHDLLVTGSANGGPLVVAVEGKADEPFDRTLKNWLATAEENPRSGARARLDGLTPQLFGATLDTEPALGALRYQLLSGIAGALADAKNADAKNVVLLIHEFDTPRTTKSRHEANAEDLGRFLHRLMPGRVLREIQSNGWTAGPVTIYGDGVWLAPHAELHVAKLLTVHASYDARLLLEDWIGRRLETLTGRVNEVLRLAGDDVIVTTDKSPDGRPVPIAWVQDAVDRLVADREIEISVGSVGYRSAFIGAVLREIPEARVVGNRIVLPA